MHSNVRMGQPQQGNQYDPLMSGPHAKMARFGGPHSSLTPPPSQSPIPPHQRMSPLPQGVAPTSQAHAQSRMQLQQPTQMSPVLKQNLMKANNKLMPLEKPQGLDPVALLGERENL